jgi:DNA-binding MarR family transcriptional regulator
MPLRRRNSVLESLERCRRLRRPMSMSHVISLLYIAENQGLNVSELADICHTTTATASRTARALMAEGAMDALPPYFGLVEARPNPADSKGRILFLTDAGRRLCAEIDEIIGQGVTIEETSGQAA